MLDATKNYETIRVARQPNEDASAVAARAAREAGTHIVGNMRRYGPFATRHHAVKTADGRRIIVAEPTP